MWKKGSYIVLVETLEGKRPFEIPRCRGENNIEIDRKALGWYGTE